MSDDLAAVVAYNAPYDLPLLHHELARHGQSLDCAGQLRVIDLHADPHRDQSRRLGRVCEYYGVPLPQEQAHTAAADALAAARLGWAHPALARLNTEELHTGQVRWKAAQAAARQARLRHTTDPAAVVSTSWSLHRAPVSA